MSGLLMRPLLTAGQDGFRDASSKHASDLYRPMGPTDCLAPRIDRSYHLSPLAAPARPVRRTCRPADLLSGECRCARHPRAVVTLARRHQLPGDAGNLIGERHRREFWRLALQQGDQPRGRGATAAAHPLGHRGTPPPTSGLRRPSSRARVILRSLVLPAVEWSFGVSPSQAAKCRPEGNARGSGGFITSVVGSIGPIPGICARRRLSVLARCQASSLASMFFSSACSCAYSLPCIANSSRASTGKASSAAMSATSGSVLSSPLAAVRPNSAA